MAGQARRGFLTGGLRQLRLSVAACECFWQQVLVSTTFALFDASSGQIVPVSKVDDWQESRLLNLGCGQSVHKSPTAQRK